MDSRGLLIVDKESKTLDSLLKAFEEQITKKNLIPPKLQEYVNPIQENLDSCFGYNTQNFLEGPPSYSDKKLSFQSLGLDTIHEVSQVEVEISQIRLNSIHEEIMIILALQ